MEELMLLSVDDITDINHKLNGKVFGVGKLDFIISKMKSKRLTGNKKNDISSVAAILWYEII